MRKSNYQSGIASLPTVMVLSLMIIIIGILITTLSFNENSTANSWNKSARALSYAEIGAKDALMKLARNKNIATSTELSLVVGGCTTPFAGCASTTIATSSGKTIITSSGRVEEVTRRVVVESEVDANGLIASSTWQELQ
jgi:hypothetical protein